MQDVGLIFLSAMASSIVHEGLKKETADADILGTTLLTLTASTFIVGLLIILVGKPIPCNGHGLWLDSWLLENSLSGEEAHNLL